MEERLINLSGSRKWRLLLSGHADPYSNMAMDEALLQSYLEFGSPPTLRIYGWKQASFSFGYFQDPLVNFNIKECEAHGMKFVRRITGGGALYHFGDISYSIVCSPEDIACAGSVVGSFKKICSFLMNMYKGLGLEPEFASSRGDYPERYARPSLTGQSLCMASNEKYDIVVGGRKLGGNAQKRRKRAMLQHGSIPLINTIASSKPFLKDSASVSDMDVTSLGEAVGREISFDEVQRRLIDAFEATFSCHCEEARSADEAIYQTYIDRLLRSPEEKPRLPRNDSAKNITNEESGLFNNLLQNKYSTKEWNLERIDNSKKAVLA